MSGFTHESAAAETVEWYTPPHVFAALGLVFGLDPCHPAARLPWVPAYETYHLPDDGLALPWFGSVWCNPPYGPETARWLKRMHEHRNGVALVFARTDARWFHDYAVPADALCFVQGRLKFVGPDGKPKPGKDGKVSSAGAGSLLIAWGEECAAALDGCGLGYVVRRSDFPTKPTGTMTTGLDEDKTA